MTADQREAVRQELLSVIAGLEDQRARLRDTQDRLLRQVLELGRVAPEEQCRVHLASSRRGAA